MRKLTMLIVCLSMMLMATLPGSKVFALPPVPSPFPVSWELKFEHAVPKRIVVQIPGKDVATAFWYLTYTVTNNTDKEQTFFPAIEMLAGDGRLIRSDKDIHASVFTAIKAHEKKQFLEPAELISGKLRIGPAEARDGVAIWEEPVARMGRFSIFIEGLSGEFVRVKDAAGADITLRKSLRLNYFIRGDEVFPGQDEINVLDSEWLMR